MDALCGSCGVEEALYKCNSCNKSFCIDDWDKFHSDNPHEKLAITFSVNEKSRETLLNYFEKIKKEKSISFNWMKEEVLAGKKGDMLVLMKYVNINSLLNAVIFYIMKVRLVTKKLIYSSIDYFLINSQILAEQYINILSLWGIYKHPTGGIDDILLYKYFNYDTINYYSQDFINNQHTNLYSVLLDILKNYLVNHKYKKALELLENSKNLLIFHKYLEFEINDSISMVQSFITEILQQNYNINLTFLKESETKLNKPEYYYGALIFYTAFQAIFYNLMNKEYFLWCSKCLLRITTNSSQLHAKRDSLIKIYRLIIEFYGIDGNYDKIEKYNIKKLHLFEKNRQLLTSNNSEIDPVLGILVSLIDTYSHTNQIAKKKKCIYKFLLFSKNYKPDFHPHLISFLFNYGKFFYFNTDYESALDYFKRTLHELKKYKYKAENLIGLIYYYIGSTYYKKSDYQNSIKNLYKAKEVTEMKFGNFVLYNIQINLILAEIYLDRFWLDESLNYLSLVKDSYLKLWGNRRTIWNNTEMLNIEYKISYIYFLKGEIDRPLKSFENILLLYEQGKVRDFTSSYRMILLNIYIGYLYYSLGNKDKFNNHIDMSLKIFDAYMLDSNFKITIIGHVLNAVLYQNNCKKCEEICLKLLEMVQDDNYRKEKLIISACLM